MPISLGSWQPLCFLFLQWKESCDGCRGLTSPSSVFQVHPRAASADFVPLWSWGMAPCQLVGLGATFPLMAVRNDRAGSISVQVARAAFRRDLEPLDGVGCEEPG